MEDCQTNALYVEIWVIFLKYAREGEMTIENLVLINHDDKMTYKSR